MTILKDNIVADRIRAKRKEKHMTQKELAAAINVSPQVISNWERGYTPEIGNADLLNLAIALRVTTDYLLGIVEHPLGGNLVEAINIQKRLNNDTLQPAPIKTDPSLPQLSPDELALIEKYRKMKDNQKDTMHKVADTIAPDEQAATFAKGC